jgi:hypothetical protein
VISSIFKFYACIMPVYSKMYSSWAIWKN